jgi:hypothetical protein
MLRHLRPLVIGNMPWETQITLTIHLELPPGINSSFKASAVYSEGLRSILSPLNAMVPSQSSRPQASIASMPLKLRQSSNTVGPTRPSCAPTWTLTSGSSRRFWTPISLSLVTRSSKATSTTSRLLSQLATSIRRLSLGGVVRIYGLRKYIASGSGDCWLKQRT